MENLGLMEYLKNHYQGKKVFVTGHTGFKGSWLVQILSLLGATIKGYALAPDQKVNLFDEIAGADLCESVIHDIRDKEALKKAILDFQPDYIFHLAAQPLVRLSYQIPIDTFEVNVLGTAHVLDALRFLDKKCSIVLITTDKVYHNNETEYAYQENDRLGGYDPYSSSKACCELVIDSYRNSFFNTHNLAEHGKSLAVARAGNVIGGGDWSLDRLIPDIAKALQNNQEIIIRNPKAVRPWQHVIEPLFGYLELGAKLRDKPVEYSQAYNFGPNESDALTVEEMVQKSIGIWGKGHYTSEINAGNPHEAGLLKLDITKALNELLWSPVFNAEIAIQRTINWYKKYDEGAAASDLIILDIEFYQNTINEKKY
jgi:CDP-glucose 4,6-dehydratase